MKIVIWGADNIGKSVLYSLNLTAPFNKNTVLCFVDKNTSKVGKTFCGKEIKSIEEISTIDFDTIIIANTHGAEIKEYIKQNLKPCTVIDFLSEGLFDPRICTLNLLAEEIHNNKIEGSIAEAGVYKGEFTQYINANFPNRTLYLFDTFEGFAENDIAEDERLNLSNDGRQMFKDTEISLVKEKLKHPDNAIFKKGHFPKTCKGLENEPYCFVSIDFDLYRPTFDAINYFYKNLSVGGYIMIHDYTNENFKGVKKAVLELKPKLGFAYFPISDGGGSIVISK